MKVAYALFVVTLLSFVIVPPIQVTTMIFSDFDSALVALWMGKNEDRTSIKTKVTRIEREWQKVKEIAYIMPQKSNKLLAFINEVDMYLATMTDCTYDLQYIEAREYAFKALWYSRYLRRSERVKDYPLDVIWDMYYEYKQIHNTVHDQMFGLKDWAEFEDMVFDLSELWNTYNGIPLEHITIYFPQIEAEKHNQLKIKFAECLKQLIIAQESGYQPDFEVPCDELGVSLDELLLLYGL